MSAAPGMGVENAVIGKKGEKNRGRCGRSKSRSLDSAAEDQFFGM